VVEKASNVVRAIRQFRFFIIGLPLLGMLAGMVSQAVLPSRDIVMAVFKLGSVALPGNPPTTIPLASDEQIRARLRATSFEIKDNYEAAILLSITFR
jgi:hypothetical protein